MYNIFILTRWLLFFSHPADYTPVCTTELGTLLKMIPEFEKRNAKIIAISCDDVASHHGWSKVSYELHRRDATGAFEFFFNTLISNVIIDVCN